MALGRRNLQDRTLKERLAILNNSKRAKGRNCQEIQRRRREKVERSFSHHFYACCTVAKSVFFNGLLDRAIFRS